MITPVFNTYAQYYDLLYRDKDYVAEADYVEGLIKRFNPGATSVLELGSGTGRHAKLLAERGFFVHGVERSEEMNAIARKRPPDPPIGQPSNPLFFQGDIRNIRLNARFDAAIALFHVISYQTSNKDVLAAFRTAYEHLNPGGIFIFDVWYGPAVLTHLPEVRIKRMADDQFAVMRLAEPVLHPNENLVDVNYHIFVRNLKTDGVEEFREIHVMRYFFKPEISLMADQTGLKVLHAEEWLTGNPVGPETWGACFCLLNGVE